MKSKERAHKILYEGDRPAAVLIDINEYKKMLARLGEEEDLKELNKVCRKKPPVGKSIQSRRKNGSEAPPNFRRKTSLDEMIKSQGVKPITDFDELAALWPGDDDADEFLEFILSERRAWRKVSKR